MTPKAKRPAPAERETAERILAETAEDRARFAEGDEPRRPGIRGAAGREDEPKRAD